MANFNYPPTPSFGASLAFPYTKPGARKPAPASRRPAPNVKPSASHPQTLKTTAIGTQSTAAPSDKGIISRPTQEDGPEEGELSEDDSYSPAEALPLSLPFGNNQ